MMSLIYIYLEECSGLPTGETIVATMGLIQEHSPRHNMDQFAYEHLLRNTEWLSDCDWMFDKSESFEYSISYIISHTIMQ